MIEIRGIKGKLREGKWRKLGEMRGEKLGEMGGNKDRKVMRTNGKWGGGKKGKCEEIRGERDMTGKEGRGRSKIKGKW